MSKPRIRFAKLRQLLLGLEFVESVVPDSHIGFRHESSDTTIMLPNYKANEVVAPRHFVPIRTLLDAKGLMTSNEFDRSLMSGSVEQSASLVAAGSNVLKLTAPRSVRVFDPTADLNRLFQDLVGGRPRLRKGGPVSAELNVLFQGLQKEGRARSNLDLEVPLLGRRLQVPYAFDDEVYNLVKPHRFASEARPAMDAAMRLAIEGDLLFKRGKDQNAPTRLVVVVVFDQNGSGDQLARSVDEVLREYNALAVLKSKGADFVAHVEQTAH